jgi:hypothetical protein
LVKFKIASSSSRTQIIPRAGNTVYQPVLIDSISEDCYL